MANPGLTTVTKTASAATNSVVSTSATENDLANYQAAGAGQDNNCDDPLVVCTPLQMAEHDIFNWRTDLMAILPAATGAAAPTFTVTTTAAHDVTITVTWSDRANTGATAFAYSVTTQIQPLIIEKNS